MEITTLSGRQSEGMERSLVARELGPAYQLVRLLGRGAMGSVYLARDLALHRVVAIKVLDLDAAAGSEARERFRREARMCAQLVHPNIVPVYAFGETSQLAYMVMQYVEGESLAERLRRERRLSAGAVRAILAELAFALEYADAQGVVHRDLKPENVLLERSGRVLLADFSVATRRSWDPVPGDRHRAFGTPHFMAPEQVAGELDVDGRSDLYALGVLGYLMLSGRLPFDGSTFGEIAAQHVAGRVPRLRSVVPGAPADLVLVIERCLAKEPANRWRHAADVHSILVTGATARPWALQATHMLRAAMLGSWGIFAGGLLRLVTWLLGRAIG